MTAFKGPWMASIPWTMRRRMWRSSLESFVGGLERCIVAMEACCGAHHLGRVFVGQGHAVRLMSPEYVRPGFPFAGRSRAITRSSTVRRSSVSATTASTKARSSSGRRASGMPNASAIASLAVMRLEKVNSRNGSGSTKDRRGGAGSGASAGHPSNAALGTCSARARRATRSARYSRRPLRCCRAAGNDATGSGRRPDDRCRRSQTTRLALANSAFSCSD